jgi:hypothetical protein
MIDEPPPFDRTGIPIEVGQHICAMYFGVPDRDKVLLPFLADGLANGDKCFAAMQEPDAGDLMSKLATLVGSEIDLPQSIAKQQLEIKTSNDQILSPDEFDPATIIEFWDATVNSALTNGFDFVRLTGEASWWLPQMPGIDSLFQYESELNRFTTTHPQAILCMYDLSQYNESIVIDLLKTHPLVLISGLALENPYYLTPDEYLATADSGPMLSSLVQSKIEQVLRG